MKNTWLSALLSLLMVVAAPAATTAAAANTGTAPATSGVRLLYDIKVWDIPIGTMTMEIKRDLAAYQLRMQGSFGGIAALFATGDGDMRATGTIENGKIVPFHLLQHVAWDEVPRTIEMWFAAGNVTRYQVTPPHKFNPETRHALDAATLINVRDPLSATIQLYDPAKSVCSYPVRVFDGRERYDLQMVAGSDDAWHCRVTPKLISGYKKKHDQPEHAPQSFDMYFTTVLNDTVLVPRLTVRPMAVGRVKIELAKVKPL